MKKIFKIILVNFIIFIFLLALSEVICYKKLEQRYEEPLKNFNRAKTGNTALIRYQRIEKFSYTDLRQSFRIFKKDNAKKKPIIIFGCSFAHGFGLSDNDVFAKRLSDLSGRTVFDRSSSGTGLQHVYYQLNTKSIQNEIPVADYIIYVFIYDHFDRLFKNRACIVSQQLMLRYKINNNKLEEIKPIFLPLNSLYTTIVIQEHILHTIHNKKVDDESRLFTKIIKESQKTAKEKFPEAKFIILVYPEPLASKYEINLDYYNKELNKLSKEGFIVINAERLVGHPLNSKEYTGKDGYHPSAKAWQEITPKLVKNLSL